MRRGVTQPRALICEAGSSSGGVSQLLDRLDGAGSMVRRIGRRPDRRAVVGEPTAYGRSQLERRLLLGPLDRPRRAFLGDDTHPHMATVPVSGQGDPKNSSSTVLHDDRRTVREVVADPLGGIVGVTDAAMAARRGAERNIGHLVARRNKRGRPTLGLAPASVESVRLDPELKDQLILRAGQDHTTPFDVIREALSRYLQPS